MKWLELWYNLVLFGFNIAGLAQIANDLEDCDNGATLKILTIFGIIIQFFHIIFNNMLQNCWYGMYRRDRKGCAIYECFEKLFCIRHGSRTYCVDRPNKLLIPKCMVKYGLFTALFFIMLDIKSKNPNIHRHNEFGWWLDIYFFCFAAQLPIFFLARMVAFPIWTILTSCYKMGDKEYDREDPFDWSIISYDYIDKYGRAYR